MIQLLSFSATLMGLFAAIIISSTLTRKYSFLITFVSWVLAVNMIYGMGIYLYGHNLESDIACTLFCQIVLCIVTNILYRDSTEVKLFMSISAGLYILILSSSLCGAINSLLGTVLDLYGSNGVYSIRNLIAVIIIKVVVLTAFSFLYIRYVRKYICATLYHTKRKMGIFLVIPFSSFLGFLTVNYIALSLDVTPESSFYLPLYTTIGFLFIMEYIQMYITVNWMAEVSKAESLVHKDGLTGLLNRMAFDEAEKEIDEALYYTRLVFSVVMIDLNYLKKINDTYGHDKGDIAIKLLAEYIQSVFINCDCYRIGGDEFVIIIRNDNAGKVRKYIHDLENLINKNMSIEKWRQVSAAIGYSFFNPNIDKKFKDVFERADELMYNNKKAMKALRDA